MSASMSLDYHKPFSVVSRRKEKEFWESVKSHLTYKGFFDKFPTPKLLREAQEEYRSIVLDPPLDDTGKPLPYPTPVSKSDLIDREAVEEIDAHALGVRNVKFILCQDLPIAFCI